MIKMVVLLMCLIAVTQTVTTIATCDCSKALMAVQADVQQLREKLSSQDRTIKRHEDVMARLTQNARYRRINDNNVNQLFFQITGRVVNLERHFAVMEQKQDQNCTKQNSNSAQSATQPDNSRQAEIKAMLVRQNRTLEDHEARTRNIEMHADNITYGASPKSTPASSPTAPFTAVSSKSTPASSTTAPSTALPTLDLNQNLTVATPAGSRFGPVVALPGGEALLADRTHRRHQVVRLDQHGQVVPPAFTSRTRERIRGLVLAGDDVYVLQRLGIISKTRLSSLNHTRAEWRVRGWRNMQPGALVGTELYLVNSANGLAFSSNVDNHNKTIRKTGLKYPISITTATSDNDQTTRFFILEYYGHHISIFNTTWDLISTIGGQHGSGDGQLSYPRQVLVTPWSTLLVADTINDRVTEFSLTGRFLRHLLTSWDGLYQPFFISYSRPYLWVVHDTRGRGPKTVRRYQLV